MGGPESMPREGMISAEQREQIKAWITGMPEAAGSPQFRAASVVIASHCVACHSDGTGLPNFALTSEAAWVSSGFVVPGMPESSYLVQRINGAGLGGDAETMPFDRPAIEPDELAAIETWIRSIP